MIARGTTLAVAMGLLLAGSAQGSQFTIRPFWVSAATYYVEWGVVREKDRR